jgi:hypothetical protein
MNALKTPIIFLGTITLKSSKLDAFLQFNEQDILTNAGKVTAEIAKAFAETEFEKYRVFKTGFWNLILTS